MEVILLVAACSSEVRCCTEKSVKEQTAESGEKQEVTFWHSMSGAGQETLNSIVEEYNKSQDKVQVNAEFQGTYEESLPKFNSCCWNR